MCHAVGDIDADDGDADGNYTTTTTVTGTLENDQLFSDDVDEDIRATQRTVAKTYYSLPEHNGTTAPAVTVSAEKTTTTANGTIAIEDPSARATRRSSAVTTTSFAPDKMFEMKPDMRYDSGRKCAMFRVQKRYVSGVNALCSGCRESLRRRICAV